MFYNNFEFMRFFIKAAVLIAIEDVASVRLSHKQSASHQLVESKVEASAGLWPFSMIFGSSEEESDDVEAAEGE